jgi:anti-sigma B factor antagonist
LVSKSEAVTTRTFEYAGATVLAVGGDVDMVTAPIFSDAVDDIVERRPAALIVDLSDMTFLASAGLQILALVPERLSPTQRFAVVAEGPATSPPIHRTKLDEVFAQYPTLEDAVAGLGLTEHPPCESTP